MNHHESVPQPLLEQWLLGQLGPDEAARVEARLRAAGHEPQLLRAEYEADNEQILKELPFAALEARLEGARGRNWRPLIPALATGLVAATLALGLWLPGQGGQEGASPRAPGNQVEGVRLKGGSRLLLYRVAEQGSELLADGAEVAAGDAIQVMFQVEQPGCVAVLSLDAGGGVSQHLPVAGGACVQVGGLEPMATPRGFVLDSSPGFERFFLLHSDGAFRLEDLEEQLRAAGPRGPVKAIAGVQVSSLLLNKTDGGVQ
jgi:hypothetical protein